MTIEEIKVELARSETVALKYVRIGDEFRFAESGIMWTKEHKDMLNEGEHAKSAGYFMLTKDKIYMMNYGSVSLKLDPLPEDKQMIFNLLQCPCGFDS